MNQLLVLPGKDLKHIFSSFTSQKHLRKSEKDFGLHFKYKGLRVPMAGIKANSEGRGEEEKYRSRKNHDKRKMGEGEHRR